MIGHRVVVSIPLANPDKVLRMLPVLLMAQSMLLDQANKYECLMTDGFHQIDILLIHHWDQLEKICVGVVGAMYSFMENCL